MLEWLQGPLRRLSQSGHFIRKYESCVEYPTLESL